MLNKTIRIFTILILSFVTINLTAATARAKEKDNIHNVMGCAKCHDAEISFNEATNSEEPVAIKGGMINICLGCHEEIMNVHHPLRVQVTEEIPDYLPVGAGNSITCITCHNLHEEGTTNHLVRKSNIGNYNSKIDICYECHKDDFKKISPHKSESTGLSRLTCHRDTPTIKDTRETVTLVSDNVEKICNFCHIVNMDEHPLNVDTSIKLNEEQLPLSTSGKIVCITCHDPHTTTNTINFLREKYVNSLEFGKYENPHNIEEYFNCIKCHTGIPNINEYTNCRYKDDFIMLCYNCHGADQEKCHPVNIPLLEGMKLPERFTLNDDGLMTCVTCHYPDCSDDKRIRYINYTKLTKESCKDCHDFSKLAGVIDPHADGIETPTDDCYYCHRKDRAMDDFGMSEKFVCLKCHAYKEHPEKSTRAITFSEESTTAKIDKKGKITCSTCHNPHVGKSEYNKLKEIDGVTVCASCHQ